MSPRTKDLALTLHVLSSLGWFGAVVVFLVLAITGLEAAQARLATGSYLAMSLATRYVIVPLCLTSLATGVAASFTTKWGLLRHYWVVIKLVLTVLATAVLLAHTRPIHEMAALAARADLLPGDHRAIRAQLVFDAGAGLVVLIVTTVLGIYKPRGATRYGRA